MVLRGILLRNTIESDEDQAMLKCSRRRRSRRRELGLNGGGGGGECNENDKCV